MSIDAYDEWRIKNQHCTADEIDERQAMELAVILDKWQAGEIPPWEVMLQTTHVVGAIYSGFLFDYEHYRDCSTAEGARKRAIADYRKYRGVLSTELKSEDPQAIADATWSLRQKYNEGVEKVKNNLRPEILDENHQSLIHENIAAIRSRLENSEFDSWAAAMAIAEVLLPSPPLGDFQIGPKAADHIKHLQELNLEDEAWQEYIDQLQNAQDRKYAQMIRNPRYAAFSHFKEGVERSKYTAAGHKKDASVTFDAFTPETENNIKRPLAVLFARRHAYETAYQAWVKEKESEYETEHGISLEQLRAQEKARKDAAYAAYMEKYSEWAQAQTAKGMVLNEFSKLYYSIGFRDEGTRNGHLKEIEYKTNKSSFRWYGEDDLHIDDKATFLAPIDFPDHKLCGGIEIVPSGTGLIQLHDKDPYHSWEPTSIGRITTYSVSFVPNNPKNLELLKDTLSKALEVLGTVPYKYTLSERTSSGESYQRVSGSDDNRWNVLFGAASSSTYVDAKDGKASPLARFDLDDLWTLYYLMEPVIEPNAQIAAAMNSARFAEERGAVLAPEDHDSFGGRDHVVADQSGYLKKSIPETMLADAMRDGLKDLALNKIDEAEFAVRISTLAQHTLTGNIADPLGNFPTFDALISDARSNKGAIMTYEAALHERTQDLLRCLLGESKDSTRPLYAALIATIREIAKPLKEQSRDQSRQRSHAWEAAYFERERERRTNPRDIMDILRKMFDEKEFAKKHSDAVTGNAGITDEEIAAKRENALATPTHIVVASSAVETAIDGVHHAHVTWEWHHFRNCEPEDDHDAEESCSGTYLTRTKGSPYVRYELPEALKQFCPQDNYRPSLRMLLGGGRQDLG